MKDFDINPEEAIESFLAQIPDDADFEIYLYRVDPKGTRSFLERYFSEIPELDIIGKSFGGGKYLEKLRYIDDKGTRTERTVTFNIDKIYDKYVKPDVPVQQPQNIMNDTISMFERLVHTMLPVMELNKKTTDESTIELTKNFNRMIQEQSMASFKAQQAMQKELMQQQQQQLSYQHYDEDDDQEEETEGGILDAVLPLMEEYLPTILGGGAKAKALIAVVKSMPMFKQIKDNRDDLDELIDHLDKEKGQDVTDKLLAQLGISR